MPIRDPRPFGDVEPMPVVSSFGFEPPKLPPHERTLFAANAVKATVELDPLVRAVLSVPNPMPHEGPITGGFISEPYPPPPHWQEQYR